MTPPELEKIDAAIVLLSAEKTSIALSAQEVATVMRDPTPSQIAPDASGQSAGLQITSLRDQVVVTIVGSKLLFQDKSDDMPVTGRLPKVVQGFLKLLKNQGLESFSAYGINFDVAFDAKGDQAASEIIADRYLNKEALSKRGQIGIRGAGMRLYFTHSDAICDMSIEPRQGKVDSPRFFAHINYHFDLPDNTMPPPDELRTRYQGMWPQFTELLEGLFVKP